MTKQILCTILDYRNRRHYGRGEAVFFVCGAPQSLRVFTRISRVGEAGTFNFVSKFSSSTDSALTKYGQYMAIIDNRCNHRESSDSVQKMAVGRLRGPPSPTITSRDVLQLLRCAQQTRRR